MSTILDKALERLTRGVLWAIHAIFGDTFWPNFEKEILPEWLQVSSYSDDEGLFALDAGGLGFGFIGPPLSGVGAAMQDKLAALMQHQMPTDTVMQFILWTSPDMEMPLTRYAADRIRAESDFLRSTCKEMVEFYRDGAYKSVVKGNDIRLRDVRLVITCKIPAPVEPTREDIVKAIELKDVVAAGLRACGFQMKPLNASDYLRFMQTIFNWGPNAAWRDTPETEWAQDVPLPMQILDPDTDVRVDERGLWLGGQRVRVLFPKRYPQVATFGQAYAYIGETMSGARGLRDPVLFSTTVWFGDREKDIQKIAKERAWVTHQAGQSITKFRPEIIDQKKSFDLASQQINDGDRIVRIAFGMALFTPDEKSSLAAVANARAYMREFGFQMLEHSFIVAPLFGNMMPFGTDVTAHAALRTFRRTTSRGAVPLLPIMSEWRGTGTPTLMLASRNGQLMTLSNWDSESSFNVCIAAESGSGKSFLTQAMIVGARQMGERFWIIDKGKSYRNIVEMVGGERLEFGRDSNICLNPFSMVSDYDDDADLLYGLISAMAALQEPLTDLQGSQLRKIMRLVFDRLGPAEMKIDHLAEALLQSEDQRIRDVGSQLYPFTREGEYGRLFYGTNNYQANSPVVLLELDELEGRAHLQRVVLLQLMFQIRREMQRGNRAQRKHLIIDEAWELLASGAVNGGNDPIAAFIAAAYRQFRKLNGAAWTITQSVNDFFLNEVTRAIYENSPHKWLLGQRGEAIEAARSEGRLDLGDHGFKLLRSVHTVRGEYSEVFAHTPYGYGVARLIVPPLSRKLFSTTATDVARITEYRKRGMSLMDAVRKVAEEDGATLTPSKRRAA